MNTYKQKLSNKQLRVLSSLTNEIRTARSIAGYLGYPATYDAIHASLRRLEDRGLVRRLDYYAKGAKWELTATGRNIIATP